MPSLAERMKAWRKREGLTQAQAGEAIGIPRHSWARFERGAQVPRKVHMTLIERLIGKGEK